MTPSLTHDDSTQWFQYPPLHSFISLRYDWAYEYGSGVTLVVAGFFQACSNFWRAVSVYSKSSFFYIIFLAFLKEDISVSGFRQFPMPYVRYSILICGDSVSFILQYVLVNSLSRFSIVQGNLVLACLALTDFNLCDSYASFYSTV